MARRLERCTQCIQRLRDKLNNTRMTTRRHELLSKAADLAERGFFPMPEQLSDIDPAELARVARLTPKPRSSTPATFNPSQSQHALLFGGVAARAWKWGREWDAHLAPGPATRSTPGPVKCGKVKLAPKPMHGAFEALLDQLFEAGEPLSLCDWLSSRHEADRDLDVSASAFLAWTCAQSDVFFKERDVRLSVRSAPRAGRIEPVRIVDAVFAPELAEALA